MIFTVLLLKNTYSLIQGMDVFIFAACYIKSYTEIIESHAADIFQYPSFLNIKDFAKIYLLDISLYDCIGNLRAT